MQDQLPLLLKISAAFLIIATAIFSKREKKQVAKPYPTAGNTTMQYYDADYVILAEAIATARNLYHLQDIRDSIMQFKKRYADYQCPVVLQIDVNRLVRLYREKKITFEIRIAIFTP